MVTCKTCMYGSDPLKRHLSGNGGGIANVFYCDHYQKRIPERDNCQYHIESPKSYFERQKEKGKNARRNT